MNIKRIVGDNIRFIRQQRKMSLEDLAHNAKMGRAYVNEIERGNKNISVDRLAKLAEALGVEPRELVIPKYYKNLNAPKLKVYC